MTYEEFDKRCDELENAPLPERKTFFADVLAGEGRPKRPMCG